MYCFPYYKEDNIFNKYKGDNIKVWRDILIKSIYHSRSVLVSLFDAVLSLDDNDWTMSMVGTEVANTSQEHPAIKIERSFY